MLTKLTTAVAIYARYSTDRQDARSIDDQLRRCHVKAKEQGFNVVTEYRDAAESGAHLERADMQRLLADIRRPGAPPFTAVLVDDLSRLSRDLGDTWQIVFGDLAVRGVRVIDVTTGMASDGAGARLTFGALALVNDTFLQLVRAETHRGLEGRAIAGFWTGGRVYGYRTIKEPNPPDPEHPRSISLIHEVESVNVRRIFQLYVDGAGYKKIACILNSESLVAPYDVKYGKRAGKGWGHATIRAMLQNERYLGKWVWNKRKWVAVSGKKAKHAVRRPPSEWVTKDHPELAIISQELWQQARAHQSTRKAKSNGRAHGEVTATPYALSGRLRCGACGSSMSIVSRQVKAGRRYPNFGCSAYRSKGESVCSNRATVSELKVTTSVFALVRTMIDDPEMPDVFIAGFKERLGEETAGSRRRPAADQERLEQEKRVHNLVEAVAVAGWSIALGEQLKLAEEKLLKLRTQTEAQDQRGSRQTAVPSVEDLQEYFEALGPLVEKAATGVKAALNGWMGQVVLHPRLRNGKPYYAATGEIKFDPTILANGRAGNSPSRGYCGGRI